jgi:hypothetical protein
MKHQPGSPAAKESLAWVVRRLAQNRQRGQLPDLWRMKNYSAKWPFPEGAWVHQDTKPFLLISHVYLALMDIPEAKVGIDTINGELATRLKAELSQCFDPVVEAAKASQPIDVRKLNLSEDAQGVIWAAYREWVNRWALGSEKMLEWVIAYNMGDVVLNRWFGGLTSEQVLQGGRSLADIGKTIKGNDLTEAWKTLYSADFHKAERAKARETARGQDFFTMREKPLVRGGRYWIAVRVQGYSEIEALETLGQEDMDRSNLSETILKPFDLAILGERPSPGRPAGAKTALRSLSADNSDKIERFLRS